MEVLGFEYGIAEGTHLMHSAVSMKAIALVRTGKSQEALTLMEKTFDNQMKQLDNDPHHPFIESTLSHLGLICKITRNLDKAIDYYSRLVDLKVRFYGENHETVANPMKNLANCFQLDQKHDDALLFYEKAEEVL